MTVFTEKAHTGGFILNEGLGHISRENITVLSGQNLTAGAVLGRKSSAATVSSAAIVGTGNGTIGTLAFGKARMNGQYRVVAIEPATDSGQFAVEDPNGVVVGRATVGSAYAGDGPAFTITDGSTDFAAGDYFLVTVTGATFKYLEYNPAGTDGSQYAVAVLLADTDATSSDLPAVGFMRHCEVNAKELVWFSGASTAQKLVGQEQLSQNTILAR